MVLRFFFIKLIGSNVYIRMVHRFVNTIMAGFSVFLFYLETKSQGCLRGGQVVPPPQCSISAAQLKMAKAQYIRQVLQ